MRLEIVLKSKVRPVTKNPRSKDVRRCSEIWNTFQRFIISNLYSLETWLPEAFSVVRITTLKQLKGSYDAQLAVLYLLLAVAYEVPLTKMGRKEWNGTTVVWIFAFTFINFFQVGKLLWPLHLFWTTNKQFFNCHAKQYPICTLLLEKWNFPSCVR